MKENRHSKWQAYWRLARFDKPVGILLLWAPTACALWIANQGKPALQLVLLFAMGTLLMRAAGCVFNDIVDREFDRQVSRTQKRPLACGELGLVEALMLLIFLLIGALVILFQLPPACFPYALAALSVTAIYPCCKRFLNAPQLVLGLAFSMGIPMAYVASNAPWDATFYSLCAINFLWIMAYDTQYAMVDRQDDQRIGVKSTAILWGKAEKWVINGLLVLMHGGWLVLGLMQQWSLWFFMAWVLGFLVLGLESRLMANREPAQCFQAFLWNAWYGLLMWVGVVAGFFRII